MTSRWFTPPDPEAEAMAMLKAAAVRRTDRGSWPTMTFRVTVPLSLTDLQARVAARRHAVEQLADQYGVEKDSELVFEVDHYEDRLVAKVRLRIPPGAAAHIVSMRERAKARRRNVAGAVLRMREAWGPGDAPVLGGKRAT